MSEIIDPTTASIGAWRPMPVHPDECNETEIADALFVRGIKIGSVCGFGHNFYPYIFDYRLGSYRSLGAARAEVEELAKLAMPLIDWIADRECPK